MPGMEIDLVNAGTLCTNISYRLAQADAILLSLGALGDRMSC